MNTTPGAMPIWLRIALTLAIVIGCGCAGVPLGNALGYAIAALVGRDPAELKDMLIWCFISTPIVMAAAGLWLATLLTRAPRWTKRAALIVLCVVLAGAASITLASYDWPKNSGVPVIDYELRLPANLTLPNQHAVDLTIWSDTVGKGCYIDGLTRVGDRQQVSGTIVLDLDNHAPTMSISWREQPDRYKAESYWRLPYRPDAGRETQFSPWQRIEFIPSPRQHLEPMPPGDYEIRYRLRRYL